MARSIPAIVNPGLLIWAREEAGYSQEEVAKKMLTKKEFTNKASQFIDKLSSWERGDLKPTLRQAEKLAKIYNRPYSVFNLSSPPAITPLAAEYRRLPNVKPGAESPELRVAIRQMIYRKKVALNLTEELGDKLEEFNLRLRLSDDPNIIALNLRKQLGIPIEAQLNWNNEFRAWHAWRTAVEKLGVLVFQFHKVNLEEVRGLSLLDFPLPIIGINNKEIAASKPFSLIHELVHIMLANANEEKPALYEQNSNKDWLHIEKLAESISGAVLLPANSVLNDPEVSNKHNNASWSVIEVRRLARRYKVTPKALITRLLKLNKCSPTAYREWLSNWDAYLKEHPPKGGGGFATPSEKALNKNGRSYTRLVLEALTLDRITSLDATRYLDLNYPHIENLRRNLAISGRYD